jgi:hypothetical protein
MKAIDKVTHRQHTICSVLGGYQVCLIPNMNWEDAGLNDVHVFTNEEFNNRFEIAE